MDLEAIAKEVMAEYQMSFGGATYDFALEVAKRAVLAEREACAKVCEELPDKFGEFSTEFTSGEGDLCARVIRARSNAEVNGAGTASG